MREFSLLGFIAELKMIERDMEELPKVIVARACAMIQKQAKAQIGHEHEEWPPLKPATIARKARGNTPLLETGELRDSIEWMIVRAQAGYAEGAVGSDLDRALWQELGTSHIPPRSFLASSAIVCEPRIYKMAGRMMMSALGGAG